MHDCANIRGKCVRCLLDTSKSPPFSTLAHVNTTTTNVLFYKKVCVSVCVCVVSM